MYKASWDDPLPSMGGQKPVWSVASQPNFYGQFAGYGKGVGYHDHKPDDEWKLISYQQISSISTLFKYFDECLYADCFHRGQTLECN